LVTGAGGSSQPPREALVGAGATVTALSITMRGVIAELAYLDASIRDSAEIVLVTCGIRS